MSTIAITEATLVDETGTRRADIAIVDGIITEVGSPLAAETLRSADMVLDADGLVVTPGFVDLRSHLREPGDEEAGTIESGTRAAALGGYTAVVAMPDTDPIVDTAAMVDQIARLAEFASCEVLPAAALTVGRRGEALVPIAELVRAGVRLFTDEGAVDGNDRLVRTALEYAAGLGHLADGAPILIGRSADAGPLSSQGHMHEGVWSSRLGLPGRPAEAELVSVQRDLALARLTGGRVHLQGVSTAAAVDAVRAAKADGLAVTADVTPHHLALDHSACASFDPVVKVLPPLRTESDIAALRDAVADGTVDAIATDHTPFARQAKEQPFADAPAGAVGLETAFAVAYTALGLDIATLVARFSTGPARIAGVQDRHGGPIEPGRPANLAVLDLDEAWTITGAALHDGAGLTPFDGHAVRGRVRHTLYQGDLMVHDGKATR